MNYEVITYFQYQGYLYWLKNQAPTMCHFVTGLVLHKSYKKTLEELYGEKSKSYVFSYRKFISLFIKGVKSGYIPFEQVPTGPAGHIAFVPKGEECFAEWGIPELYHLNRDKALPD